MTTLSYYSNSGTLAPMDPLLMLENRLWSCTAWLESQQCNLIVAVTLSSLGLSFFIYKIGIIIAPTNGVVVRVLNELILESV